MEQKEGTRPMTRYDSLTALAGELGCQVLLNEPLSRHTTFKIGGPAPVYIIADTPEALAALIAQCSRENVPFFLLGNGSNLLVGDNGLDCPVLRLSEKAVGIRQEGSDLICGAGVPLSALAAYAQKKGLAGMEFSWGIPGTVGGAVYMNAGAYGGEMKQVVSSCRFITPEGAVAQLDGEALCFSYRRSAYTQNNGVVTQVRVTLKPGDPAEISARMAEIMEKRKSKQPLEYPSAGSVFKRPEGHFAGALIEQCGLKGRRIGGAQVSEKHAGFIINRGGATCSDVKRLVELIQETVLRQTGISLECEIKSIGY